MSLANQLFESRLVRVLQITPGRHARIVVIVSDSTLEEAIPSTEASSHARTASASKCGAGIQTRCQGRCRCELQVTTRVVPGAIDFVGYASRGILGIIVLGAECCGLDGEGQGRHERGGVGAEVFGLVTRGDELIDDGVDVAG